LKGAARGEISSDEMVTRITNLAVLPEDMKASSEGDENG
jgi:hypothetical protein